VSLMYVRLRHLSSRAARTATKRPPSENL